MGGPGWGGEYFQRKRFPTFLYADIPMRIVSDAPNDRMVLITIILVN
jgi:hypothetical protein